MEEVNELMPESIEALQNVASVTLLRAEARTAQAFDNGASAHVRRELWEAAPMPREPSMAAGGVPPVLREEDHGFAAYRRLHELRAEFKSRVTVVKGSISQLPFKVDAVVLPADAYPVDVNFGACHAIYVEANGGISAKEKPLDDHMRLNYLPQAPVPIASCLPSPSFEMSDRCDHLLHSVGPTWPVHELDVIGRAIRWWRLDGEADPEDEPWDRKTWAWFTDVDGSQSGDNIGYGTGEEKDLTLDPQYRRVHSLAKYHSTMLRRQCVRDLCVTYENIFDAAAELGAKTIALPGISTGSRACPNLTAAAVAFDVVQQRLAAGTCPDKVYFVAFDDRANIFGAFSDVRQEILRRYELLIRPVDDRMAWRGGGWRDISERYDAASERSQQQQREYLRSLIAQDNPELRPAVEAAQANLDQDAAERREAEEDEARRRALDAAQSGEEGAPPSPRPAEGFPGAEPEPEPEGGEGEAWQESTLMPLRRTIQVREPPCCVAIGSVRLLTGARFAQIHSVDLAKEYKIAGKAVYAYQAATSRYY